MGKRVGFGYLASCVLPLAAIVVLMLRLAEPHTRALAVGLYLIGTVGLIFALRRHGRMRKKFSAAKKHALVSLEKLGLLKKRAVFALAVFSGTLVLFPILIPWESSAFLHEDPSSLRKELDRATEQIKKSEQTVTRARRQLALLASRANLSDRSSIQVLKEAWASYLDHAILLDRLVASHKHFYQLAFRSPQLADRAFLVGYYALVVQMNAGAGIVDAIHDQPLIETLLNEGDARLGLPAGTYSTLQRGVTSPESLVRLEAGYGYLKVLRGAGRFNDPLTQEHVHDLARATILQYGQDPGMLLDAPFDRFERKTFSAWFPLQKGAAELISPLRAKKRDNLINGRDLNWARERLRSGDILLQRRNWYLTNLGIPGFWPHAALYVGTLSELDEEFEKESRGPTLGLPPSDYLEQYLPKVFQALTTLDDAGRPPRVIEAIGEGVVLHPFEESGHADYMAALRPRLTDEQRLATLLRAFSHYGKPYDYNFEFSTDDALVCSELVYKALQAEEGTATVVFPLTKQNGRYILPPNDIAKIFDEQYGTREQQLDFVFFLDGNEALGRATFNDVNALRTSWKRPKWDIVQP